jgi:hypothetical protein
VVFAGFEPPTGEHRPKGKRVRVHTYGLYYKHITGDK